jgi:hypothetical protein
MPDRQIAKQGQPDDQPHDMLGGQLAPPDRGFARRLQRLLNPGRINQLAQAAQIARYAFQRMGQFGLKFHEKRDVINTSLFTSCQPVGLTDWAVSSLKRNTGKVFLLEC